MDQYSVGIANSFNPNPKTGMYGTVIVGGGMAGLTVAHELAKRGESVLLLDRYGNWGGRVYTYHGPKGLTYEVGAGRIHKDHRRVNALVKRYGLKTFPIGTESLWEGEGPNPFLEMFTPIRAALETLPAKELGKHTIEELVPKPLHPILKMYPYTSEIDLLRADVALPLFKPTATMGTVKPDFYGVVGGLDQLPHRLAGEAMAAGAELKDEHKVLDVKRQSTGLFEVKAEHKEKVLTFTARRVVLAVCKCNLDAFKILKGAPVLKQINTGALMRIYAIYPKLGGKVWFEGMPKVVSAGPLRYVIPINPKTGLIMISYTDGKDTEFWRPLKDAALQSEIQKQVKALFPDHHIPEPTYLKKHDWPGGCTYWLPGDYDVEKASRAAHNPSKGVYICGESISTEQTWIEGALQSAETLLEMLE